MTASQKRHIVIVTPDLVGPVRNGGIGTFCWHLTRLLAPQYRVTILFTSLPEQTDARWQTHYAIPGVTVKRLKPDPSPMRVYGDWWFMRRSRAVHAALPPDADLIIGQDWHANLFHTLRLRRFSGLPDVPVALVLHSNTRWAEMGMGAFPDEVYQNSSLNFAERYAAEQADFVLSPSQYMLDWVQSAGWRLRGSTHVLGLPFVPDTSAATPNAPRRPIKRLVFFGRLETRKGLHLFVQMLEHLKRRHPAHLTGLEAIVFLGKIGVHGLGDDLAAALRDRLGDDVTIHLLSDRSSAEAQSYLRQHAPETLVLVPSLRENFPYALIELTQIPNLDFLTTPVGGIPELLGTRAEQHCVPPRVNAWVDALERRLQTRAVSHRPYDFERYNALWRDTITAMMPDTSRRAARRSIQPPRVDVCVTHFNDGDHLPATLAALAAQQGAAMQVTVIDDASDDPVAHEIFARMQRTYPQWRFIALSENVGTAQARNQAAGAGDAPYLLFVDSDNVPVPSMVRRFAEALVRSGADCLTCYMRGFVGDAAPFSVHPRTGALRERVPVRYEYRPLGADQVQGIFTNVFGDANCIVRREVFEALAGFPTPMADTPDLGYEDYAFFARLVLRGYDLDVLPDVLFYYRHREDSLLRRTQPHLNQLRILQTYAEIAPLDLLHQAYGLYLATEYGATVTGRQHLDPAWVTDHVPWYTLIAALGRKLRKYSPF